jgi:lysophospholipase L1-like esterase
MKQFSILCYGDSNTWGFVPQSNHTLPKARYNRDVRWTGILQTNLGDEFHVIEEGLNSRTTNLDHVSPPDRNGKTYLAPCLYSHAPLDLVVLALGGNDTKTYFNRTAEQITHGLADLIDVIQASTYGTDMSAAPMILITTCAIPCTSIEACVDEDGVKFMLGAVSKSRELVGLYGQLAKVKGCFFLDLSTEVMPSQIDGVHYDEIGHKRCAEMVEGKIRELFG